MSPTQAWAGGQNEAQGTVAVPQLRTAALWGRLGVSVGPLLWGLPRAFSFRKWSPSRPEKPFSAPAEPRARGD